MKTCNAFNWLCTGVTHLGTIQPSKSKSHTVHKVGHQYRTFQIKLNTTSDMRNCFTTEQLILSSLYYNICPNNEKKKEVSI